MKRFWKILLIFLGFLLVLAVNLSTLEILADDNYGKKTVVLESKKDRTIALGSISEF